MQRTGENILAHFQKILNDAVHENLKYGGINFKYFTWTGIRLKKDRGQVFPQMILDAKVQRILNWQTAIVIMDQTLMNEDVHLTESIMHESIKRNIEPISIVLYNIDDQLKRQKKRSAIREILQLFDGRSQSKQQFMIFSKFYEDIIEIAENMRLFHVGNQWLFFIFEDTRRDFDVTSVTQNLKEGANIAFALNETRSECQKSLNCTLNELSTALVSAISQMTFEEQSLYGAVSDEEWEYIRYTKQEQQHEILSFMRNYLKDHISCSSCAKWRVITALTWGKNQEHQSIVHAMGVSENRNKNFEFANVGYWSPTSGFVAHELLFPHVVHYFRNITLDIVTVHRYSIKPHKETSNTISLHVNVSDMDFINRRDICYRADPIFGELLSTYFTFKSARTLHTEKLFLVYIWRSIAARCILLENLTSTSVYCQIFEFSGGMYLPKADSGRLIIGVWWIVVIVLVTTYCGNLVAFLTFPRFQPGFDYLHQLFIHGDFKEELGLRNNTFFENYAAISSRLDFQKYLNHAIVYNNSLQENLEAVKIGSRINVDWRINLQLIIQNHFEKEKECTLSMSKESFLDEQIGLIIPIDSPYLDLINAQIYRLYQMGFIERWHQTNLPSMDKCNAKGVLRQITNHKVNLDDMQGCFLVLLTGNFYIFLCAATLDNNNKNLGFIVAGIVILGEFWHYQWHLKQITRRKFFSE
uniref:Ionotropic glutamate receptor C-terminal domain-containing protein n=1 Tax=Glossina austeni TaxID=7395 RepID=A0A1A9V502_GLOAU